MKYIILGIKDYCKDCWHDFLLRNLQKYYEGRPIRFISIITGRLLNAFPWKEGNMWYYIQQRKISNRVKKDKKKEFDRRKKEITDIWNSK